MSFIEELQALDEGMKRKVLIVTTIVIMVIILFFWVAYFNNIVTGGSQAPVVAQAGTGQTVQQEVQQSAPPTASGESVWQHIANGFTGIFHDFGSIFNGTRQYNIQPQNS